MMAVGSVNVLPPSTCDKQGRGTSTPPVRLRQRVDVEAPALIRHKNMVASDACVPRPRLRLTECL